MALIKILQRWDGSTLFEVEAVDIRDAVEQAVKAGADLRWADLTSAKLRSADLRSADLRSAKNVRLPTGETLEEYFAVTVPALLTAAGKSLESFETHWECHSWSNCPMAHAFDARDLVDVPMLLRPRAEQFIALFDAKQIPWSVIEAAIATAATA